MRLDKFISQSVGVSRSDAKKLIAQKRTKINGNLVTDAAIKVDLDSIVKFDNRSLISLSELSSKRYFVLNKPMGYICSTQDEDYPSALNLISDLPSGVRKNFHFAGRLDVDTTGLVLISNDGQWTHRITSPKKKQKKIYRVSTAEVITDEQIEQLLVGVLLKGEKSKTLPAEVEQIDNKTILLTIFEGRYHQVKRMLAAVGNHVEALHRVQIGMIDLMDLEEGEYRELKLDEIEGF